MKYLLTAVFVVCCVPLVQAQPEENPYKKAKVGDWAEYKMTTSAMGKEIEGTIKMTVTAVSDKEATLQTTMDLGGFKLPAQTSKIDLTKPYDPTSTANLPKGAEAKVQKAGDGKEKITVGGKEYASTWMKFKIAATFKGVSLDAEMKVWTAKEVALSGMVKMEMTSNLANMTMEFTKSGKKK